MSNPAARRPARRTRPAGTDRHVRVWPRNC